uniref:Uncharacterized protein n=2 Tax=Brassica oleracea TaxID=3712 RepID=A0A0D3DBX3_BRAOL|nr:unnamed protein product [Brassica oleracea]
MHLWPSLKLRNSFKSTSKKKYQRTNSSGQHSQSNQQKLLESGPEIPSGNWFYVVCGDLAMVLSCCFCCFCCGGLISECLSYLPPQTLVIKSQKHICNLLVIPPPLLPTMINLY